jgi:hypothetical protein
MRKLLLPVGLISVACVVVAQAPKKSTPAAESDRPKFKAVWEPANYSKDIICWM